MAVAAAFQSWGHDGVSSLYLASQRGQECVDSFVESHYQSGTFATLHTFECEEEARAAYAAQFEEAQ